MLTSLALIFLTGLLLASLFEKLKLPRIIGMLLAILGYTVVGPVMSAILVVLAAGVNILVVHGLLPLVAIFIEPAKVLFLNNAINHGIFTKKKTKKKKKKKK